MEISVLTIVAVVLPVVATMLLATFVLSAVVFLHASPPAKGKAGQ